MAKEKEYDPFGYTVAVESTPYGREVNDGCLLNFDEKEPCIPDPCSHIQYKNKKGIETTGGSCVKKDASKIDFNFRTNPDESYQKWELDQAKYIKVSWE